MTFKVTKFVHSCLLVETSGRVALFDPGMMSTSSISIDSLSQLDDIFITHSHGDHIDVPFIQKLVDKFPNIRITTTEEVVKQLKAEGIKASVEAPEGVQIFDAPHEEVQPLFPNPEEIGVHYLDSLTHPGDSYSFNETKAILALPVTAPWGASTKGIALALKLKPKYVLPIHDWHWRDEARQGMYDIFEDVLGKQGITFHKLETGKPAEITV